MSRRTVAILVVVLVGLGACGGSGDSAASIAAFCRLVKTDNTKLAPSTAGRSPADLVVTSNALKVLLTRSPGGIKADVKTLSNGFADLVKGDRYAVQSNLRQLDAAGNNLKAYVKDKCNIDLKTLT